MWFYVFCEDTNQGKKQQINSSDMSFNKFFICKLLLVCSLVYGCNFQNSSSNKYSINTPKKPKVAIQPFGDVDTSHAHAIQKAIVAYYGFETSILPSKPLPDFTKNTQVAKVMGLKLPLRYRADSLIAFLKKSLPPEYDHLIGLTNQDITTTIRDKNRKIKEPTWMHADWGIFGLGYRPGKSCVVSIYRIQNYYDKKSTKNRVAKVAKHELGHNLGLNHCPHEKCFMRQVDLRFAIKSLDDEPEFLCDSCRKIISNKFLLKPLDL